MKVAACIIEHEWEILLLQRHSDHKFGGTWAEPGGKLDIGEDYETAMIREIFEESSIILHPWQADVLFKKYHRFDDTNITITFYHTILQTRPSIILSENEHWNYTWVSPKEALTMNLIENFDEILREVYWL